MKAILKINWFKHAAIGLLTGWLLTAPEILFAQGESTPETALIGQSQSFFYWLMIPLVMIAILLGIIVFLLTIKNPEKASLGYLLDFSGKTADDPLMDHDYDGLQELDNPVPAWLKGILYFSIFWGIAYLLHFHVFKTGNLSAAEYAAEMIEADELYKDVELPEGAIVQSSDSRVLADGKEIFIELCANCHGQKGEGLIGPNMTDAYWLHGGKITDIYKTIAIGVPEKGMISWKKQLTSRQRLDVANYILSLQGTNPPNARQPEGKLDNGEAAIASPAHSSGTSSDSLQQNSKDSLEIKKDSLQH